MTATREETKIIWEGAQRVLPPGSIVYGVTELAAKWECSKGLISKWVKYLVQSERIVNEPSPRGCVASICNWDSYQSYMDERIGEREQLVNTTRTQREHNENLNGEVKKERKNTARTGIRATYSESFEKIWKLYGKVGKKADASKALEDLSLTQEEFTHLLKAIPSYIADCRRADRKQQYLGTFLREDWRDWYRTTPAEPQESDQAGFDHIRRLNAQALAKVSRDGAV